MFVCFLVISVRDDSTRAIFQENVLDPILNRVSVGVGVKASFERQKKIRHKVVDVDVDDGGWKFKNFDLQNWSKSPKVELSDDLSEHFRQEQFHDLRTKLQICGVILLYTGCSDRLFTTT